MKKLFLLTLTALFFIACEGPMGPVGPAGPQGTPGRDGQDGDGTSVDWIEKHVAIDWDMWSEEEDLTGPYLYYEISEPRLTNDVLENPTTQMETYYRYRLEEGDTERYVPLSYSDFWSDKQEYFTVEYSNKTITIIYKNSTGTEGPELDTYDFTVRIVWNDI